MSEPTTRSEMPTPADQWVDRLADGMREHERERASVDGTSGRFPKFQRYDIVETLGSGGMAVVYRAVDRAANRPVALKVLRDSACVSDLLRARFIREAHAIAKLSHGNVVTIYDAGEEDGRMYLAMELVQGEPLSRVLKAARHDVRGLVRLLEKVARGVHHVHEHGIVHRDLKPANILLSDSREPKVTDFGLAQLVEEPSKGGVRMGTPFYMAPEQVRGDAAAITVRTDVYALGVMLYEILAGLPPHAAETPAEFYAKVQREEAQPLRNLNPGIPRELETIALKALEKDPARRYATAEAFAEDLRRYLAGEPILARPASMTARIWRRTVKARAVVVPTAAAALLALSVAMWTIVSVVGRRERVREALAEARRLEGAGRLEEASIAFRLARELDADNAEASEGDQRVTAALLRRFEAQAQALRLAPQVDQVHRYLYNPNADWPALLRRLDETQKQLEEVVACAPRMPLGHFLLGRAWEIRGELDRAETAWRTAVAVDPGFGPAHYQLARLLLTRAYLATFTPWGETPEAGAAEAERLAEEASQWVDTAMKHMSGVESALQREIASAMRSLVGRDMPAVRRIVRDALDRFEHAEGAEELHWLDGLTRPTLDERLEAFDRAVAMRPWYALARLGRASVRAQMGNFDGALADASAAVLVNGSWVAAWETRGLVYLRRKEYGPALADFDRAVRLDAKFAPGWFGRGLVRLARSEDEAAAAEFTEAMQLWPHWGAPCGRRAVARERLGQVRGAVEDARRALELGVSAPQRLELEELLQRHE